MVMDRSTSDTPVVAVELLFPGVGSGDAALTVAVLLIRPAGVESVVCTTSVKVADAPPASVAIEHETVPPEPAGGLTQMKAGPLFCVFDTKVVVAGRVSDNVTVCASLGPLFVTMIV